MYEKSHFNRHLTRDDRVRIEALFRQGHDKKEIADAVGTSYETVRRELKRGACRLLNGKTWVYYTSYSAKVAQDDYDARAARKGRRDKLGADYDYAAFIEHKISADKYSVDAALSAARNAGYSLAVSRTTLYRYIDQGYFSLDNSCLPQGKRTKKEHPKRLPARSAYRSIERRDVPRHDVGQWEMDTVVGKAKGKSECLLILTERHSRQELIMKMNARTASNTVPHHRLLLPPICQL